MRQFLFILFCLAIIICYENDARKLYASGSATIEAEGVGTTREKAEISALRSAVRQVVGQIVDTETQIINDKIIETILLTSRGCVKSHKILSAVKDEEGTWTVKIQAVVLRKPIGERLRANGMSSVDVQGSEIAARLALQKGQDTDNIRMVAKYFRDNLFPYSLIKLTTEDNLSFQEERDSRSSLAVASDSINTGSMTVTVKVSVDHEKYRTFVNGLREILDQFAIQKYSTSLYMGMPHPNYVHPAYDDWHHMEVSKFLRMETKKQLKSDSITLFLFHSGRGSSFKNDIRKVKGTAYELPAYFDQFFEQYQKLIPSAQISTHNQAGDATNTEAIDLCTPYYERPFNLVIDYQAYLRGNRMLPSNLYTRYCYVIAPMQQDRGFLISSFKFNKEVIIPFDTLNNMTKHSVRIIADNPQLTRFYEKLFAEKTEAD